MSNTTRFLCLCEDIDIILALEYRPLYNTHKDAPVYAVWFYDCTYTDSSVGLADLGCKQHLLLNRDHLAAMCLLVDEDARYEYVRSCKLGIYHPSYKDD